MRHFCAGWYRNINLFVISISFRISLSPRLTLIRLTLIRNPEFFGEEVSHLLYRYLCLHLLFSPLHSGSRLLIQRKENAPLPMFAHPIASVVCLCPIIIHARPLD